MAFPLFDAPSLEDSRPVSVIHIALLEICPAILAYTGQFAATPSTQLMPPGAWANCLICELFQSYHLALAESYSKHETWPDLPPQSMLP